MNIIELIELPPNRYPEIDCLKGVFYFNGLGVPKDLVKAAYYFKISSRTFLSAKYAYGQLLLNGLGVEKNETLGVKLLASVAIKGYIPAALALVIFYKNQGDLKKVFKWCKVASNFGCPVSTYSVACSYEFGDGVRKNLLLSYEYYLKAASTDSYSACARLAEIYSDGLLNQKKNKRLAKKFLIRSKSLQALSDANLVQSIKQAAVGGHKNSQLFLCMLYEKGGFGIEENQKKSTFWKERGNEFLEP